MGKKRVAAKVKAKKQRKPARKIAAAAVVAMAPPAVGAVPGATSLQHFQALGLRRQAMREQVAADRAQRYAKYLPKIRQARAQQQKAMASVPAAAPAVVAAAVAAAPATRVLNILAEGDSWFDYPLPIFQGDGVIYQLQKLLGYPIANMAHYGEEMIQMVGLSLRQEIVSRLSNPPDGTPYDAMLFSGGGNDLVGDQLCVWLVDSPPAPPPTNMLNPVAFGAALKTLEAEYRELAGLRDQYSPGTIIFVNTYDFPAVTGDGVCGYGPWLKPSLDYIYGQLGVNPPNAADEATVVQTLLQQFKVMLQGVAASVSKFVVVPTQGTLSPTSADWQNEIHPSSSGFVKIAQKFQTALQAAFP